jgi:polyketide cyclase/dehydrase/lipid transport protein
MRIAALTAIALGLAAPAAAAVVDAQPNGFEVREEAQIAAPPAEVYAAIGRIGRWWSSEHTYSGSAANLSLDLSAGGCFCEKLADGGVVRHLTVILVQPGTAVRMQGALGPLAGTGGAGHLSLGVAAKGSGSVVVLTYDFGGYAKGGMDKWAAPVDQVLASQVGRLKRYVETGRPD